MGGDGVDRSLSVPEATLDDYRNDPDCNWALEWPKSLPVRQALAERCSRRMASSQRMVVDVLERLLMVLGSETTIIYRSKCSAISARGVTRQPLGTKDCARKCSGVFSINKERFAVDDDSVVAPGAEHQTTSTGGKVAH